MDSTSRYHQAPAPVIAAGSRSGHRMMEPPSLREVALPPTFLASLRRTLAREAGSMPAIRALRAAGSEFGEEVAVQLSAEMASAGTSPAHGTFWDRLRNHLRRRGWGTLEHDRPHEAVGLLASVDWAESDASSEDQTSCVFSSGLVAGLLSHMAGRPVAVMEIECVSRGDGRCAFAFGSEQAVKHLHDALVAHGDLRRALDNLGAPSA
jgi:hypothetical protein